MCYFCRYHLNLASSTISVIFTSSDLRVSSLFYNFSDELPSPAVFDSHSISEGCSTKFLCLFYETFLVYFDFHFRAKKSRIALSGLPSFRESKVIVLPQDHTDPQLTSGKSSKNCPNRLHPRSSNTTKTTATNVIDLEKEPEGLKNVRYFLWQIRKSFASVADVSLTNIRRFGSADQYTTNVGEVMRKTLPAYLVCCPTVNNP